MTDLFGADEIRLNYTNITPGIGGLPRHHMFLAWQRGPA